MEEATLTEKEIFAILEAVVTASEQVKFSQVNGSMIAIRALVETAVQDLGLIQDFEQYAEEQQEAVNKLAANPCLYGGE